MRIHVLTLQGKYIFGALNIGHLDRTEMVHLSGEPVYKMSCGQLVLCSQDMLRRISERLRINGL